MPEAVLTAVVMIRFGYQTGKEGNGMAYFYTYYGNVLYYAQVATEDDFMKLYKRDVFGKLDKEERVFSSTTVPTARGRANVNRVVRLQ